MDTDTMEAASVLTTEKTNDTRSPSIEAAIEAILTKKRLKENSFTGKELLINKRKKQGGNWQSYQSVLSTQIELFYHIWRTPLRNKIYVKFLKLKF